MSVLVEIPDVETSQIIAETATHVARGSLTLLENGQSLVVRVDHAAFELAGNVEWFTHADDSSAYLFPAPVIGSGSFIRLQIRDTADRDRLEEVLVARGHLKAGAAATFDEIGRSVQQDSHANATAISSKAQEHVDSTSGASQPTSFSETTHTMAESARSATQTASEWTSAAASTISGAVAGVGAKVSEAIAGSEPGPVSHAAKVVGETASAVGSGIAGVTTATGNAVHQVVEHEHGDQAASLASKAGQTTQNTGQILADGFVATSLTSHAASAGAGAATGSK